RREYGLPRSSSVKATNGVEVSCPKPASHACCGVQCAPRSSEYEIQTVWNDCSIETLQPVAFCARSAAIHATKMRPAWGRPGGTMATPAGTVLQNVYPWATSVPVTAPGVTLGLASTSCGAPKLAPPSCEMFTQIWLGP